LLFAALLSFQFGADAPRKQPKYLRPVDVDWQSIVPAPPAESSPQYKRDIDAVLQWQEKRSKDEIARCEAEAPGTGFFFANVLGKWFNAKSLPYTAELLSQVNTDTNSISEAAKRRWKRPRPYQADARVKPCIGLENTTSYPSGHATRGIVWATVLAEIFPEHRDELLAKGKQFGDDRVIAGVHYPTDVAAGQKLGAAIAEKLLAHPDFQTDLQRAKDECLATASH